MRVLHQKNLLTYDVLVNTFWVSTTLALILTLPSIGIFLFAFLETGNWITGALLAFGIHFVILAFSEKISNFLLKFSFFEEAAILTLTYLSASSTDLIAQCPDKT